MQWELITVYNSWRSIKQQLFQLPGVTVKISPLHVCQLKVSRQSNQLTLLLCQFTAAGGSAGNWMIGSHSWLSLSVYLYNTTQRVQSEKSTSPAFRAANAQHLPRVSPSIKSAAPAPAINLCGRYIWVTLTKRAWVQFSDFPSQRETRGLAVAFVQHVAGHPASVSDHLSQVDSAPPQNRKTSKGSKCSQCLYCFVVSVETLVTSITSAYQQWFQVRFSIFQAVLEYFSIGVGGSVTWCCGGHCML